MFHLVLYYLEKPIQDFQLTSLEVPFSCIFAGIFLPLPSFKHVVSLSHSIARAELQKHSLTLPQILLKANVQAKQKYMQQYLNISLQPDQKYLVPLAAPGFNSGMCGTARDWILFLVAHQLKFTSIRTPTAFSIMQGVSIRVK